jgi:DNA-binding CsgD family transcriptional regulator
VDALVMGYEAGKSMKELAFEFNLNRVTVSSYLRRAEVPLRRPGLDPKQAGEVAHLYAAGWSSGMLAERFEVSAHTILKTLRQVGVTIRPRRGGPASTGRIA